MYEDVKNENDRIKSTLESEIDYLMQENMRKDVSKINDPKE